MYNKNSQTYSFIALTAIIACTFFTTLLHSWVQTYNTIWFTLHLCLIPPPFIVLILTSLGVATD